LALNVPITNKSATAAAPVVNKPSLASLSKRRAAQHARDEEAGARTTGRQAGRQAHLRSAAAEDRDRRRKAGRMLGNNENDVKVDVGAQQQPVPVVYATAQPAAQGGAAMGGAVPVMATPVQQQQQPQPQVIYVQAPPMMVNGRPVLVGGACACGGAGTIVTQQVSGCQILSFVLLLLFFWPLCWLPFCMDQCCECSRRSHTTQHPTDPFVAVSLPIPAQTPRKYAVLAAVVFTRSRKATAERGPCRAPPPSPEEPARVAASYGYSRR
jgi:hypothetical protein